MRHAILLTLLALSSPSLVGCSSSTSSGGDQGSSCSANVAPSSDDTTTVQGAFQNANDGDTICFAAGDYKFTDELTLDANDVTLKGDPSTKFDFSGMKGGANGLHIQANGALVDTLEIDDPKGDGIRADLAEGFTVRNVKVIWHETDDAKKTSDGPYGIYPVQSSKVEIENCVVSGASDTGIYVGQSQQISVHDNEVYGNVCGIEIENSTDAEVFDNNAHDNAGGILVFALPGLPMKDSGRAYVHDNKSEHNNGANFAAQGNIVKIVPQGTGILVMASDDNEIAKNTISDNESAGIAVISWAVSGMKANDPQYDIYPQGNFIHDNMLSGDGKNPQAIAKELAGLIKTSTIPELAWDGETDPSKPNTDGSLTNCFKDNGDATFIDFDYKDLGKNTSTDIGPYTCTHPGLPSISTKGFPGEM